MGVQNNEVVLATTWNDEVIMELEQWIEDEVPDEYQGLFVTIPSIVNGEKTIIMAPDGSKKGWETAKICDKIRRRFIHQFSKYAYEDGSNPISWVMIGYGEFGQMVLMGNNKNYYSDETYAGISHDDF